MKRDDLIVVRGGGDLATGVVHRLWSAGLRVLVLETAHPAAIRRQVSLCEAVYEGETCFLYQLAHKSLTSFGGKSAGSIYIVYGYLLSVVSHDIRKHLKGGNDFSVFLYKQGVFFFVNPIEE